MLCKSVPPVSLFVLLAAPLIGSLAAQTVRPSFDVASIKANKSGGGRHSISLDLPGGLATATNVSLQTMMTAAYQLPTGRILGMPGWSDSLYFDIQARADGNPGIDQKRLMLQSLLADRFKLALHHETRQLAVYALVLAKPGKLGPQLHANNEKCPDPPPESSPPTCNNLTVNGTPGKMSFVGQKTTMEHFVANLGSASARNLDRPIVDRTGLTGTFDFSLEFASGLTASQPGASDPSAPPSIFTALQEQLGLKLVPETGPVDVLVIDHVEQPSEN
jgi:uncharacterized protein (TIGR03435 family)